ncbi:MAG: primosomal protein N' [Cyanobacteria bacterium P01_D01_bin.105]
MKELGRVELPEKTSQWVEVLVDCPGATGLYTYCSPVDLAVQAGDIVSVQFGAQRLGAIVIRTTLKPPDGLDPSSIKPVESVVNRAFFTKEYWHLLIRVARYYQTPFIRVIRSALPPGLLSKSQKRVRLRNHHEIENAGEKTAAEKVKNAAQSADLSGLATQLWNTLQASSKGDYSWQYLCAQLKRTAKQTYSTSQANQALRILTEKGMVDSYLSPPRSPQAKKRQAVILVQAELSASCELTPRQREILQAFVQHGGDLWLSDALQLLQTTSKTLKAIADRGYLVIEPREVLRAGSHSTAQPDRAKSLTPDQVTALGKINAMHGYSEALLHGVTGAGKTEVYLQAIAPLLKAKKSALVLVPEIGLTPQLTDRFRSRFGEQVCIYHSGLSEGERYDTWRQMLMGQAQVIIGTRSAIFAPLPNLGMIVLDEEHDSSFKQDQPMPCYHARQVARWRAELESCPLILGSATPSVETWVRFHPQPLAAPAKRRFSNPNDQSEAAPILAQSAEEGNLHYLSLPTRVHARPLPPIQVVDMRQEFQMGNRTIFSRPLQTALEEMLERGEQGILFIHRRGHSSFVSCRSCGYVMECPNCDVSLSFHQTRHNGHVRLRCHYCGYAQAQPAACPACASPYLKNFGSGTQRVVNDLAQYLPQARCIRFDSDTTRTKGAHRALLARFAQGEADLLVGTQMLTKGIDLPQVTLVGVMAADGLLFMADYRASERAFQTMTQVAGRAGRGERPGQVIVQTYSPEHVAIEALKKTQQASGYAEFLQAELSDRAEQSYPPYGKLALIKVSGLDAQISERAANKIARQLSQRLNAHMPTSSDASYAVLGPVPAPIFRVARRYRWHILIKLTLSAALPNISNLQSQVPKGVSLSIDVDPLNLS